jgi:ParB-like chromosome segregation protein Spo0J
MKIVSVKTENIKPYWRNPRHNADAVDEVRRSIEKYGFNVPLVLDRDDIIITGHTRYKAMLQLGAKKIPCVYADLDKKTAKEYRIADNKLSELAKWDMDLLKTEMREFDLDDLVPGFSQDEMDKFIKEFAPMEVIEFPDPIEEMEAQAGGMTPEEKAEAADRQEEYNKAREKALAEQEKALQKQREEMARRQAKFEEKEAKMKDQFKEREATFKDKFIDCICPDCGHEFTLDYTELKRRVEVHGIR